MAVQTATATQAKTSAFFNLPSQRLAGAEDKRYFGESQTHTVCTNWRTYQDQPLTSSNLLDLFANRIPVIRHKGLLTDDERRKMLEVVKSHTLGEYDTEFTWPRVGTSGITQYDHISDPQKYFDKVPEAMALQERWKTEAGVNVLERVMQCLKQATNMPVRLAREGDREYFAGILRAVERGINIHADYAPYEAAGWSIDKVVSQLTWNILINQVTGGDTLIYDRQWRAPDDDQDWRKELAKDSYKPQMLDGRPFKAMQAVAGDLTFFNPRNFHEVKACDTSRDQPVPEIRFTVSSFVGYLPPTGSEAATLVLWS